MLFSLSRMASQIRNLLWVKAALEYRPLCLRDTVGEAAIARGQINDQGLWPHHTGQRLSYHYGFLHYHGDPGMTDSIRLVSRRMDMH